MSFLDRLNEPSTHAGIALAIKSSEIFFPQYAAVVNCLSMLFGAMAVAMPENSAVQKVAEITAPPKFSPEQMAWLKQNSPLAGSVAPKTIGE